MKPDGLCFDVLRAASAYRVTVSRALIKQGFGNWSRFVRHLNFRA